MQKWEYKVVEAYKESTEKELNELGKQGWELVAIVPKYDSELGGSFGRFTLDPVALFAYLKRLLSN